MRVIDDAVARPALADRLYDEAVALADEARTYFGMHSKLDRQRLAPIDRVLYTCESLRISTRLMHVISWLMVRKAVARGEITAEEGLRAERRLGDAELCQQTERGALRRMPPMVSSLSYRSQAIFDRAWRMEQDLLAQAARQDRPHIGARALLDQLERVY
ncbi:MAG: DUF1465 family protein [Alphaproteobacteria bacterium]|nr:MAG: DUF1465 family protein [Alphaproteobacteria bacterium]